MGEPRMGAVDKWEANDYILARKQNTKIALDGGACEKEEGRSANLCPAITRTITRLTS